MRKLYVVTRCDRALIFGGVSTHFQTSVYQKIKVFPEIAEFDSPPGDEKRSNLFVDLNLGESRMGGLVLAAMYPELSPAIVTHQYFVRLVQERAMRAGVRSLPKVLVTAFLGLVG